MAMKARRERGAVMVLAAVWLTAIIAISAIAIEVSRLTDTATEVQVAADSAALAAAENMLNGGTTTSATATAHTVAGRNQTDGRAPAPGNVTIEFGTYKKTTGFTPGPPDNAARATVAIPNVRYLLASVLNRATSTTVTKRAVATYEPLGGTHPAPVTICDCDPALQQFSPDHPCNGPLSGPLTQTPDGTQTSCWLVNGSEAADWLTACGGTGSPLVSVGDSIDLRNGQVVPVLKAFQDCVRQGVHEYVIPIIKCSPCTIGQCNHSAEVEGFATIYIDRPSDVDSSGGNKSITFKQVCNNHAAGSGGSTSTGGKLNLGTGFVKLVDDRSGT